MAVRPDLALLVNPRSGRRRTVRRADRVAGYLSAHGYAVTTLQGDSAEESAALARKVVAEEYDVLTVMGGDGMVHLALQAAAGSQTTLGVIPTGTGNDFARALGIPRRGPLAAAGVIAAAHTRSLDLARVGPTYFGTVLASGFDSAVTERANAAEWRWPQGQLRYIASTVAELGVFRPLSYTLELDGERMDCEAMLVAVGNTRSYGGGIRMCEHAVPDDGLLDVAIIKPVSTAQLVRVFPRLFRGTHVTHPAYQTHRVRRVRLAADTVAYADGERLGPLPVTVDAVPGAVEVFTAP